MKYRANKPLYLTEADWAKLPDGVKPKQYSFPPVPQRDKKTGENDFKKPDLPPVAVHDLPDNEFVLGLAAEGILIPVDKPKKARQTTGRTRPQPVEGKNAPAKSRGPVDDESEEE